MAYSWWLSTLSIKEESSLPSSTKALTTPLCCDQRENNGSISFCTFNFVTILSKIIVMMILMRFIHVFQ